MIMVIRRGKDITLLAQVMGEMIWEHLLKNFAYFLGQFVPFAFKT